ncbi:hypothetical protein RQP46_008419 [Phenoliferia psychrophenolica]
MAPRRVVSRADLPTPSPSPAPPTVAERASSKPTPTTAAAASSPLESLISSYLKNTSKHLKLLDAFQFFLMLTGVAQFLYCALITNYPFNAFLGGFSATVGQFVLTASMRSQVNPENKGVFPTVSPERAFGDFIFGSMVLHFFVYNYLG